MHKAAKKACKALKHGLTSKEIKEVKKAVEQLKIEFCGLNDQE